MGFKNIVGGMRDYWRRRGFNDGRRGKSRLFVERRGQVVPTGEPDVEIEDMEEKGRAYLAGYEAGEEA